MIKRFFRFLEWLRSRFPDPVNDCSLYKEEGCSHVDGFLCNFPECSMNKEYEKKKKELEVFVFNHHMFDKYCEDNSITDDNVEEHNDEAFISIIGTPEIMEYYLQDSTGHWFQKEHPNVLNLEFDDVTTDNVFDHRNGYGELMSLHAFTMSEKQAEKCVDFIESNLGKNFRIHCKAGRSRSAAIARFLITCYAEYEKAKENPDNPCITYNPGVLATLKRAWYKNNKMFT